MATNQEEGPSKASFKVLISKLILIVSELCCGSDGVFVDRLENDVYPTISKLMQDILPKDSSHSIMDFFPGHQPPPLLFANKEFLIATHLPLPQVYF